MFHHRQALRADGTPADVGLAYIDRVDVAKLRTAIDVVDDSGVMGLLELWAAEDGHDPAKGGRPRIVSLRTTLILMAVLAIDNAPLHLSRAAQIITDRATDNALKHLGLPSRDRDDYVSKAGRRCWYNRVWYSWHSIMDCMDLYPELSYKRRLTKGEYEAAVESRDPEFIEMRRQRLTLFNSRLIMAAARLIGEENFARWEGSVAVDGTPLKAANNGTTRRSSRVSSEPDAGWYVREGEHRGDEKSGDPTLTWAYEATVATMTFPATDDGMPSLIVGMSLDKPGHNIGIRAVDALTHIIKDETLPRGFFIGDRAYLPNSKPENLALPLRRAGYKMMGDQRVDSMGVKASYEGAELIDGHWYLACMPKNLKNAGIDFAAGKISEDVFQSRIDARAPYRLRLKTTKPDGSTVYYNPANYGRYTTVEVPGIPVPANAPRNLVTALKSDLPPKPLRKGLLIGKHTLSIPFEVGAKYEQQGPRWATPEWATIYHRGRNTVESRNDLLKGGRYASLGDQTTRMVRGFTANALFVALGCVSVNVGLVRRYLHRLVVDFSEKPKPPTPPKRRLSDEFLGDIREANAPPQKKAA